MNISTLLSFALIAALLSVTHVDNAQAATTAANRPIIELWPDGPPGKATELAETEEPPKGDHVSRITNVNRPTMMLYAAKRSDKPAPAVLICPGGGYRILSFDKEGTEVAEWLNTLGITAAVLKYRVPGNRDGALQDAQRAMGVLRHHAKKWNIDPRRVGVLGFSAGGHLAARLSTNCDKRTYAAVDEADRESCRPDFAILIYPAYLSKPAKRYELPANIPVTDKTPPAWLVQAQNDRKYVDSSIAYYLALKAAGVPAELHLYPTGGHGGGLRPSPHPMSQWPKPCEAWLRATGVIE